MEVFNLKMINKSRLFSSKKSLIELKKKRKKLKINLTQSKAKKSMELRDGIKAQRKMMCVDKICLPWFRFRLCME